MCDIMQLYVKYVINHGWSHKDVTDIWSLCASEVGRRSNYISIAIVIGSVTQGLTIYPPLSRIKYVLLMFMNALTLKLPAINA